MWGEVCACGVCVSSKEGAGKGLVGGGGKVCSKSSRGHLLEVSKERCGKTRPKIFKSFRGFSGVSVVKNPPANTGETGSIPGLGRSHKLRSN